MDFVETRESASRSPSAHAQLHSVVGSWRLVSLLTIVSRVLGMARDSAMAALFGAGPLMDAFTVAFRIPNLARGLFGEGALTAAFVPAFIEHRNTQGVAAAHRLSIAVWLWTLLVLGVWVLLLEAVLCSALVWGNPTAEGWLLMALTALMMPYVVLICLTALGCAALQAMGKFGATASMSSVMNTTWLMTIVLVAPWFPPGLPQMIAICIGILFSGAFQLATTAVSLHFCQFQWAWPHPIERQAVRKLVSHVLPILGGLSITQLNTLVDSFIAWGFAAPEGAAGTAMWNGGPHYPLTAGVASALYLGQRLYQFPLGVFGVSLGTVLFPLFSEHAQQKNWERLRLDAAWGIRLCLAIGIPAGAGLWLTSGSVATLFFQYGKFTAADATMTAQMISGYGAGVWAMCLLLILKRVYYAVGDRVTPLKTGGAAMGLDIVLNFSSIWVLGGAGLAYSTTFVSIAEALWLATMLRRHGCRPNRDEWLSCLWKTIVATAAMTIVCLVLQNQLPSPGGSLLNRLTQVAIPCLAGGLAYLVTARQLGLNEPFELMFRKQRVAHESGD